MTRTTVSGRTLAKVISASSVGTMIEWYDFYIFGMLAKTISVQFFPEGNETAALLSTLAIFAAGFIVRPFGALVFGRLGDKVGRKHTFLLTLVLMGAATFLIGVVPGYKQIGIAAPVLVLLLRLLQGLALGGEYGGAATYVAEYAPEGRRGFFTSWIQTTATLGLFLALGVIMAVKMNMSDAAFNADWGGWRYPFWASALLVGVSIFIRLRMAESPLFSMLKSEGKTSVNPLKESFGNRENFRMVLLALFGAVMGQGVIWYTGQFYAQSFLENTVRLDFVESRSILLWAIAFATPFFVFFGWLSDRIGRKWIMITGMLLGVLCYRDLPGIKDWGIYNSLLRGAQVDEGRIAYDNIVWQSAVARKVEPLRAGNGTVRTSTDTIQLREGLRFVRMRADTAFVPTPIVAHYSKPVYKDKVLPPATRRLFIFLVFLQVLFVTMVYGPIAAFLVELFPTRIRYTSMSLPYHIGNGIFGGLVPFIGVLLSATYPSDPLVGLWYPVGVAALCALIGILYIGHRNGLLQRVAGLAWLLLGPLLVFLLLKGAAQHINFTGSRDINKPVPWMIIIAVFVPIAAGLVVFGWYAWKGDYEKAATTAE
ncbi:MFS transporter [Flaviaesturariibacter flavus]|uniref:MFS transporter n=1 Tax=Flaviaesturariibacter flavus TaxID=2502780 RepID=A0A4R1B7L9_9BACT|nr:MFS transporter [Flaviaesturariibacter flavus]TCJ12568.1 MFS transporter [Flaviaesturariibacter flavus]